MVIVSTAGRGSTVKLSVCSTVWEGAEVSRSVNVWVVVACRRRCAGDCAGRRIQQEIARKCRRDGPRVRERASRTAE